VVNVRIPATPAMLLRLMRDFSILRDIAQVRGEPWPADLEEWSEALDRSANVERA
jgi:hypothetical protein